MQPPTFLSILLLFLACIWQNEGLLLQGHSDNPNNTMHGLLGQHVNMEDVVQMFHNLTAEFQNLKQQTAEKNIQIETLKQQNNEKNVEIDTLKQQFEILKNQTKTLQQQNIEKSAQITTLKQQTDNDKVTIQLLQNRVFSLEAEQNKLSNLASNQTHELSAHLSGINQLTRSLIANEATDRDLTQQLHIAVQTIEDLKLKDASTKQQIQNQSLELQMLKQRSDGDRLRLNANEAIDRNLTKQLSTAIQALADLKQREKSSANQFNASLIQVMNDIQKLKTDRNNNNAFTAGISSGNNGWAGSTLVFPDVVYSMGTGYNSQTGIFTATTPGTYVFYVSVQSDWQKYIWLDIVLNGSTKVRAMAYYTSGSSISIRQTGTNLVILHLQTGDRVWVKQVGGTGYYSSSGHVTTFSGFKLY